MVGWQTNITIKTKEVVRYRTPTVIIKKQEVWSPWGWISYLREEGAFYNNIKITTPEFRNFSSKCRPGFLIGLFLIRCHVLSNTCSTYSTYNTYITYKHRPHHPHTQPSLGSHTGGGWRKRGGEGGGKWPNETLLSILSLLSILLSTTSALRSRRCPRA